MSGAAEAAGPSLAHHVQVLADLYAKAWNAADMDAMAELYAPDVHWVNIVGMHCSRACLCDWKKSSPSRR